MRDATTHPAAQPDAPPELGLRLLDGFELQRQGRAVATPHSVRRLLAFLAVRGRCGRAEAAGTLWPDTSEERAHACLRTVLWRLAKLADRPLVVERESLALAGEVHVDLHELIAAARGVLDAPDPPPSAARLAALSSMGELLPGWYEDWVLFERERLRQLRLHALETAAARLTRVGRFADAVEAAMSAVRLEPLRESATRALIAAHLAEHNVVEALRRFESFRTELASELGVRPTAELEALVRAGLRS